MKISLKSLGLQREQRYLILIMLLAAGLRIFRMGHFGFWFDEAASWHLAQFSPAKIIELAKIDNTPPVYHILLHYWLKTGVDSDFMVKLPALLFGIFTVFMTYKLALSLFDRKTALFAAFLGAVSYAGIHYSQENRMYSLQMFLALISTYYFLRGLDENRISHWILWFLSGALMFYNHLFAVFLFLAQGVYFIVDWKHSRIKIKYWVIFNGLLAIVCAFWIPVILRQMNVIHENYWVQPAKLKEILEVFIRLTGGTFFENKYILATVLHVPFYLLFGLGFLKAYRSHFSHKWLLPVVIIIPLAVVFIYSQQGKSLFFYRYFLFLAPFIQILSALGFIYIANKYIKIAVFSSLIIVNTIFLSGYYTVSEYSEPQRLPTKAVIETLDTIGNPGDVILHQGVSNLGIESFYVSLRYNRGRYEDYLWRKDELPFYFGMQFMPEGRKIVDLNRFKDRNLIWVITVPFGKGTDEDGLPVISDAKKALFDYELYPDDLFTNLKSLGLKVNSIKDFKRLLLIEFVKSEVN